MAYLDQMYGSGPQRTAPMGDSSIEMYPGMEPPMRKGAMTPEQYSVWAGQNQGPDAMFNTQQTRATAQSATPYTPLKGKWYDMSGVTEGLPGQKQGYWGLDPNVDYGQAPVAGASQVFDVNTGDMTGWTTQSGERGTFQDWQIDPTTGQLSNPTQGSQTIGDTTTKGRIGRYGTALFGSIIGGAGAAYLAAPAAASGGTSALTAAEAAALSAEAGGLSVEAAAGLGAGEAAAGTGGLSLEAASYLPEAAEAVSGAAGQTPMYGGLESATPWWQTAFDTAKTGKEYYDYAQKAYDLYKGIYDTGQNKDYAGNMKGIYSDLNRRQDQFRDQLLASYQDPNQFYGSNQWKGLESVYQNSIDRDAAKAGRLGNPTDREVLMQSHAMKELENYRRGLRESAGLTRPESALEAAARGYEAERNAAMPIGASLDRMYGQPAPGSRQSSADIAKQIASFGGDMKKIYDFVSGWFK